jgi:hypothetical protein
VKDPAQLALISGIPVVERKGEKVARMNEATYNWLMGSHTAVLVGPFCRCRSFRLPHELDRHRQLRGDWDWRSWEERKDFGVDLAPRRREVAPEIPEDVLQEWYA